MRSDYVPVSMQRRVRERARQMREYCGISQDFQEATFHIDHINPRSAGGHSTLQNLALACVSCSLRKGARTAADDPQSRQVADLFNPRLNAWIEHFEITTDCRLIGLTPTGRATVEALQMNRAMAVALRRREVALRGRKP